MESLPSSTIICRTGWCDICAKENRPHTGQRFITIGSKGRYHVYHVDHVPKRYGFTPHLYRLNKSIGNDVVYDMLCCMEDCGVYLDDNASTGKIDFCLLPDKWRRGLMLLIDWNALVLRCKQDPDYFV
jgi:hypothetical protein